MIEGAAQSAVRAQLGRFGFSGPRAQQRVDKLSGGERARLALALMLFVFFFGPTRDLLNSTAANVGTYVQQLPGLSFQTFPGDADAQSWQSGWTLFYWGWWISWSPFVGMFLARISRGRTIREFVGGVILAPSLVSLVWFCIFGGTAITQAQQGTQFSDDSNVQLFQMLGAYPWATATGLLVMVLVAIFFVSGADAASIVMGTLSQRGTPGVRRCAAPRRPRSARRAPVPSSPGPPPRSGAAAPSSPHRPPRRAARR